MKFTGQDHQINLNTGKGKYKFCYLEVRNKIKSHMKNNNQIELTIKSEIYILLCYISSVWN